MIPLQLSFGVFIILYIMVGLLWSHNIYISWSQELTSKIVHVETSKDDESNGSDFCNQGNYRFNSVFTPINEKLPNVTVVVFPHNFNWKTIRAWAMEALPQF